MIAAGVIFITIAITCARGYPNYWGGTSLSPVHGLYVKPSGDGTTGDLFVAATEDRGVKSQWVVDQPINFLQAPAATPAHTTLPLPYPGLTLPHDESSTHKCSTISATTPPVQYAYALPVPSSDGNSVISYPYAYPVPASTSESSTSKCESSSTAPQYPFQFPFQYFYPQMMSAYSNAMSILKDAGLSEDTASSAMASPMWPPSSYAYPMYVMIDPSAWAQSQTSTTPSPTTASPTTEEEESAA